MCGIAGLMDPSRRRDADGLRSLMAEMAAPMVHRGPDGHGDWIDPAAGVALVHRRLSVIDLSEAGRQPMESSDGRWVITYNGEVYGHRRLAERLNADGVRRRGHSDTELLVESVARWGLESTLERIDGMFAFALWDRQERRLHLVRDRVGEKPLYHGRTTSGAVVFGSSLDSLCALPEFDRTVNRDALALFFRHKYVPCPLSIYRHASKVPPGCVVTVEDDGRIGLPEPYWTWPGLEEPVPPFRGVAGDAVDQLDELLRESVRERLVADVPVGAFLSGGIDSTAVVAAAQQVSASPVRTFTIGSDQTDFDESADARRVARLLGTEHTEVVVTGRDALSVVDLLPRMYDEPFADSSQIPARLVSALARRSVTVALTGDGGDELFGGYTRYVWGPAMWSRLAGRPLRLRRLAARLGGSVPPSWWDRAAAALPASRRPRQLGIKAAKAVSVLDAPTEQETFRRLCSHWPRPQRLVLGASEPPTPHSDPARWPRSGSFAERMALVDAVTYLPDDILAKVDRAAMSVSLEGRIPLLARPVVEFAASLPWDLKVCDGRQKWVLRQVAYRSVPAELLDRPKAGFGVPIASWLRGPLRQWGQDLVLDPVLDDVLDRRSRMDAWRDHQTGAANHAYRLWDVAMFAAWSRERNR